MEKLKNEKTIVQDSTTKNDIRDNRVKNELNRVKDEYKIRAEIEQNAYPIVHGVNNHEKGMTLYGVLQIIDKYKAESEETVEE